MKYAFLLFLLLPQLACNNADTEDVQPKPQPPTSAVCGNLIEVLPDQADWPSGPNLEGAKVVSVDGTCIVIEYTWVGCSDQGLPLRLLTDGITGDSNPYAAYAQLRFSENNDVTPCAIFTGRLDTFDLAPYLGPDDLPANLTIAGADTTVLVQ